MATFVDNNSDGSARRARLRPKPSKMFDELLGGKILQPIRAHNGMVWPYQPLISYQQEVEYAPVSMVHTNQDFYAYTKTPSVKLTCEGEFTVQNQTEGLYALACIHFLRTMTKMYFGQGNHLGTPPPILLFDAYGDYIFNKLPVIVTQFNAGFPKDIDYVPISTAFAIEGFTNNKGSVWLPSVFTISVSMTVQNMPSKLTTFKLDDFRTGKLLKDGGWV